MDDEDFVTGADAPYLSDGEEDHVEEEKKHAKLLDSISALDGHKRSKLSERTVLTQSMSEFGFTQGRAERKVNLSELIGSLQHTTSHGELKKQLRAVNRGKKVARVPLSKVEEAKIQRTSAYEQTKEDLAKWNSVVNENRKAEQIFFPLQQPSLKLQTTEEVKSRFKPRTPLEKEIAALLHKSGDTMGSQDAELTPAEERALKAMSLQEARERRAELQKYRALLTFKQAKAKREKKIKSKKYHRILKKERLKHEKIKMEELQRTDPEAYVEKLQSLDKDRVKERMSLKHRGGSKFAQRQKLYGKYDDRSRDAIQDMLQLNKELTQKVSLEKDDDSESGVSLPSEDEDENDDVDIATFGIQRGDNPWMNAKSPKETDGKLYFDGHGASSSEGNLDPESFLVQPKIEKKRKACDRRSDSDQVIEQCGSQVVVKEIKEESSPPKKKKSKAKKNLETKHTVKIDNDLESNQIDSIFENLSQSRLKIAKEIELGEDGGNKKKKKKKQKNKEKSKTELKSDVREKKMSKVPKESKENDEMDSGNEDDKELNISLTRKRTLEDVEMEEGYIAGHSHHKKAKPKVADIPKTGSRAPRPSSELVDPKKVFTLETKIMNSASVDLVVDEDDDMDAEEEQRMTIAQAFADDDVIAEFSKEKTDVVKTATPADIDLTLPGWGEWGGAGLKPSKKKRKRFTLKAPKVGPRQDKDLSNVIINEKKDNSIAKHQVSRLPFPYTSPKQFEQSIRAPIGKNWNPETAFRKMIQPKVMIKLGSVIAPIDKSDVFDKQKSKTTEGALSFELSKSKKTMAKGRTAHAKGKQRG